MQNLKNVKIKIVKDYEITGGDTIIIDGKAHTISKKFIKSDPLGITINGLKFRNGVELVLFPKYFRNELIGYFSQI